MRRWLIAGLTVLAGAVAAAPAPAAVICVGREDADCQPPVETNLQTALTRAQAQAGADEVRLRAGTFRSTTTGGFTYASATDPVTIRGAGRGLTRVANGVLRPTSVLSVDGPAGSTAVLVRDLDVFAGEPANGGQALTVVDGTAEDVLASVVGGDNVQTQAISLTRGIARRVRALSQGAFAAGLAARASAIVDADLDGAVGITAQPSGTVVLDRTRIRADRVGVEVCNTRVEAGSLAVQVLSGIGVEVAGAARCGGEASSFLGRGLTITGPPDGRAGTGLVVSGNVTDPVADLRDSVLWGLTETIEARPLAGRTSTVTLARLAEEPARRDLGGAGTLVLTDGGGNVGDPLLTADGRLGAGSPAIDAGPAGPLDAPFGPLDLAGAPRLLDGDGDGTARVDLGAFEAPAVVRPPAVAPAAPAVPAVPAGPPAPAVPPPAAAPDTTAPALGSLQLVRGRRPVLRARLSEAATLRLELRGLPAGCRRASARCRERTLARQTARRTAGQVQVVLSRTLRGRLPRATRLRVTATDAAGNRSRVRAVRVAR